MERLTGHQLASEIRDEAQPAAADGIGLDGLRCHGRDAGLHEHLDDRIPGALIFLEDVVLGPRFRRGRQALRHRGGGDQQKQRADHRQR